MVKLPSLYVILDTALAPDAVKAAGAILRGGATLLQYRHKGVFTRRHFDECATIAAMSREHGATFIVNDRADVALIAGAAGVHLGQDDLPAASVRGFASALCIGLSTHIPAQVSDADAQPVDYVAIGPVYATSTKANHDPVIGLAGVREARRLTAKPLVAIGGITRDNFRAVLDAGADSVAIARDILASPDIEAAVRSIRT